MATTIDLGKIRLQWKGDYSNATSYELLDVVKFKGDSYVFISTIAAANKTPDTTSEWDLMVSGGDQWSTGTSVPTGGNPGDMYLKTDDEKVYTNTAGSWGVVGDMGGSRWTSGTSAPSGGEDGDFYLKTDDEKVYERVSGSWTVKLDIGGGVWTSGTSVPTGGEAGDFYIKTDDEKIYENVAGTWTVKLDIGGGVWTSSTSNGSGGESGDWHINTTTKDIQENVSGTWTTRVNLSVSGSNIQDLGNVPALSSGKFLTNDGTNTSWATVDVTGASVGGDVSGTVSNIQIAANAVTDTELNSAKLNNVADNANNYSHPGTHPASMLTGSLPAIDGSALTGMPAGGKVLGMSYLKHTGRERSTGRLTGLTVSYVKKSSTSRLVCQSFIFGEISDHDCRLSLWNSVDGYFSENGYQECALKVDEGGYYGGDTNSTPGTASHLAVTSQIAAGTNVEFRWYVKSDTFQLGGSYNTSGNSWEHAASWMMITEVEA
mgnify:CR=1 FL=1